MVREPTTIPLHQRAQLSIKSKLDHSQFQSLFHIFHPSICRNICYSVAKILSDLWYGNWLDFQSFSQHFFIQFPALFDGCSFYLSGEFQSTPTKSEVLEIIRLGGGQLLHREPKVETSHPLITPASPAVMKMMSSKSIEVPTVAYHAKPNTAQSNCTQYILYDKQSLECHKRISSPILCTASTTWIMECISKFEIVEVKEP